MRTPPERVLVTGAGGFIGSQVAWFLAKKGCQVIALDRFRGGTYRNLYGFPGEIVCADIRTADYERLFRARTVDAIVHMAAITDTTETDEEVMLSVNVEGFRRLLEFAVDREIPVVYASSAAVYGKQKPPHHEDLPPDPQNLYAFSKVEMERLAGRYAELYGVRSLGLRFFNVYGPREAHKGKARSMVRQILDALRADRRPRLFPHGEQKRDWVYIADAVQAVWRALLYPGAGVWNVGSGRAETFNRIVEIGNALLGKNLEPEWIPNPYAFYQEHTEADLQRARRELGYEPKYSLEEGMRAYVEELLRGEPVPSAL